MGVDILHTADWHLGHNKVATSSIVNNIRKYLLPSLTDKMIFFIAGDTFDSVISMNSHDASEVIDLFVDIFTICSEKDITVRVLQGTYSHDRNQIRMLSTVHTKGGFICDFRTIEKISVETVKDTTILYLPDDLPFTSKRKLFTHISNMMMTEGISTVDYAVVHGEFDIASQKFMTPHTYTINDFKFVTKNILAGHIHTPMHRGKLIYSGSIERLRHNEEHHKGYWVCRDSRWSFVRNDDATMFLTYSIRSDDVDGVFSEIKQVLSRSYKGGKGYLRLRFPDISMRNAVRTIMRNEYPDIQLTFEKNATKNIDDSFIEKKLFGEGDSVDLAVPSEGNIANIIYNHIKENNTGSMSLPDIQDILELANDNGR